MIARDLAPDNITEQMGMTGALISPQNTTGFEAIEVNMFPGKGRPQANSKPKIEIEYESPACDEANTTMSGLCDDQPVDGDTLGYLEVTVDEVSSLGGQFDKEAFERICEQPDERLAKQIRKKARDVVRKMNKTLIAKAYSVMGLYPSDGASSVGGTAKSINILNADGFINPAGMAVVKSQFRRMHTDRLPIVVGGDILATWEDTRVMGGLGANAVGAQTGVQQGGVSLFLDYHLDPVIQGLETDTDSHLLSWVPGTLRLLEWAKYKGPWEELGKEDYTETTLNIDGIAFDYSLYYDNCDHVWKYVVSKTYDLFWIPDAVYQPCWTFNHKLHFKAACGTWDCNAYQL